MIDLISFSVGVILLAIVIALVAFAVMVLAVPLIGNRSLAPLSYLTALIFTIILAVFNSFYIGLTETKNQLERFEHSPEYRIAQRGQELLGENNEDLADMVGLFIGEDVSAETIAYQKSQINKYLWINGLLCVVVFVIGVGVVIATAGSGKVRQNRSYSDRGRSSHTGHRGDEFNGRRRHRQ